MKGNILIAAFFVLSILLLVGGSWTWNSYQNGRSLAGCLGEGLFVSLNSVECISRVKQSTLFEIHIMQLERYKSSLIKAAEEDKCLPLKEDVLKYAQCITDK